MIKNYILVAIRNMNRHKGYAFINIIGLSIGMTCCLFITLWIVDELSYDQFHKDIDSICQVLLHYTDGNAISPSTPIPLATTLKEEVSDIVYATRYKLMDEVLLSYKENMFYEDGIWIVDADFFKIFNFPFLQGDPFTALEDIHSIVISENIARKYFYGENPVGKVLTANHERDYIVSGVIKNVPHNSTIQFDMVVRYEFRIMNTLERAMDTNVWWWWTTNTFVKIRENTSFNELSIRLADFVKKHDDEQNVLISFMPLAKRNFFWGDTDKYITIFSIVAIFILGIACINFMCLSTARSGKRAGEIGIRKVVGANRENIIIQFLTESFVLTLTALVITLLSISLLLPLFNSVTGKGLRIEIMGNWTLLFALFGLVLVTTLVSGSYPAFFLASFKPTAMLASTVKMKSTGSLFRKALVIIQFSISICLIVGTATVYRQLEYMKNKDVGYVKDHLVTISLSENSRGYYPVLKNSLLSDDRIVSVSATLDNLPYFVGKLNDVDWNGKDPDSEVWICYNYVDYDFFKTLGVEFIEGSDFPRESVSDTEFDYIVNEEMLKLMGTEKAVGRIIQIEEFPGTIVGVIKNVHFQPLTDQIEPMIFFLDLQQISHMLIRMRSGDVSSTIQFIEQTWKNIVPMYPFEYQIVSDQFNRSYVGIQRMGRLLNVFTCIAIFIACLGLLGLASFIAEQRSKEIGVRKVLGASIPGITITLSREFAQWVLIATLIAWPVIWFAMTKWLHSFAYRIHTEWWIFISAGIIAFVVALLTVSVKLLKTALANPVDSLRYE